MMTVEIPPSFIMETPTAVSGADILRLAKWRGNECDLENQHRPRVLVNGAPRSSLYSPATARIPRQPRYNAVQKVSTTKLQFVWRFYGGYRRLVWILQWFNIVLLGVGRPAHRSPTVAPAPNYVSPRRTAYTKALPAYLKDAGQRAALLHLHPNLDAALSSPSNSGLDSS